MSSPLAASSHNSSLSDMGGPGASPGIVPSQVLDNERSPARDIVMLNAGTALYAANVVADIREGIARSRQVLESGAAREKLDELVRVSKRLAG